MAVEFSGANYIEFSPVPNTDNLTTRTISFWINPDSVAITQFVLLKQSAKWYATLSTNDLYFNQAFSGGIAQWGTYNHVTAGSWQHIAITYDSSDPVNDPIFYVGAVLRSIDDEANSTGTASDDSGQNIRISTSANGIDGKLQDPRIYNVILTPTEIGELFNSRCQRSVSRGLVFAPYLDGAKGLSRFDGVTLGAANTIVDEIGGAIGVPSGNPIGRGNTIQRIY